MDILCLGLTAFWIALLVRVVFSWIPRPPDPLLGVERGARLVTDWAVAPLREVIPPLRLGAVALDVSIIVLFLGVNIIQAVIGC